MTDMAGAVGDVATGTLIAREVDMHPAARDAAHGLCLNCGTRLMGAHCHACGQSGHVHRTMGAIGHEIAHGVFHFEGKIWRTLPMLVLRPGELTRRYVAGERVRFVAPLAIFLFTVFLMFAVVASLPAWRMGNGGALDTGNRLSEVLAKERRNADAAIADVSADLTRARADPEPNARRIARLQRRLADAREAREQIDRAGRMLPQVVPTGEIRSNSTLVDDHWIETKIKIARENPDLLIYKLKSSAYKFSWALIPLSTPFVALLFLWRRRFGLYDHAVFVTYSLTFMSLLVIALVLARMAGSGAAWTTLAVFTIPPVHMYKQLRGAYGLSRFGAGWRTVALLVFALVVLLGFGLALLFNGLSH